MQRGQSLGLIEQSMMQSLFKMKDLATMNPNEIDSDALQNFNEIEIQKVIYLGCLGRINNSHMILNNSLKDSIILSKKL